MRNFNSCAGQELEGVRGGCVSEKYRSGQEDAGRRVDTENYPICLAFSTDKQHLLRDSTTNPICMKSFLNTYPVMAELKNSLDHRVTYVVIHTPILRYSASPSTKLLMTN